MGTRSVRRAAPTNIPNRAACKQQILKACVSHEQENKLKRLEAARRAKEAEKRKTAQPLEANRKAEEARKALEAKHKKVLAGMVVVDTRKCDGCGEQKKYFTQFPGYEMCTDCAE